MEYVGINVANLMLYVHTKPGHAETVSYLVSHIKLRPFDLLIFEPRLKKFQNRSSEFPTRSDTNRSVQLQKRARCLQFRI